MIRAARWKLRRGQVEDALPRARRDHVHKTEQVLIRVAKAHAAPDARLVERSRARHVERDHALIGVPDVDHAVRVSVRRADLQDAEQAIPIRPQRIEGGVHVGLVEILGDDRLDRTLVDRLRVRRIELFVGRIFVVSQHKDDLACLARLERHLDVMRSDGLPAVRDRVERFAALDCGGVIPAAIRAEERFALRVETRQRLGAGKVGKMIAPLAVFGLVIDHAPP